MSSGPAGPEPTGRKPVLFVDVDGVISLFGFEEAAAPPGAFHSVNGVLHYILDGCGERLLSLRDRYELVWATGWEETANEFLPHLLGLPGALPFLAFDSPPSFGTAHWKLSAIEAYAGSERPLAWIDDSLDESCRAWAEARPGPTLLVPMQPEQGLCDVHVERLIDWAKRLEGRAAG
jgi:hypothetical protein